LGWWTGKATVTLVAVAGDGGRWSQLVEDAGVGAGGGGELGNLDAVESMGRRRRRSATCRWLGLRGGDRCGDGGRSRQHRNGEC